MTRRNLYCAEHEFTYPESGSCFYCHGEREKAREAEERRAQEIVGHKTFSDGHGGFRHEPLTRAEADAIWARCEELRAKRAADMPDVPAAIRALTDAYRRLEELGWGDATGCPKDGSEFEVIEPGSSGIHRCIYRGEWPDGKWWILHDGDMSPSRPVLWRRIGSCAHMFKRPECENCGGRDVPKLNLKAFASTGGTEQ